MQTLLLSSAPTFGGDEIGIDFAAGESPIGTFKTTFAWDLVLDAQGNIAVASEPYALAQDAASECRLFAGEAFYDTGRGIPYWGQILGLRPPLSLVRAYLVQAALLVPGVVKAAAFFSGFTDRQLTGQVQVTDSAGVTIASAF